MIGYNDITFSEFKKQLVKRKMATVVEISNLERIFSGAGRRSSNDSCTGEVSRRDCTSCGLITKEITGRIKGKGKMEKERKQE